MMLSLPPIGPSPAPKDLVQDARFRVMRTVGHIENGKVCHYQVTLSVVYDGGGGVVGVE